MTGADLGYVTNALILAVFAGAALAAARTRTRPSIDAALFFGVLGSALVLIDIEDLYGSQAPVPLGHAVIVLALAVPYLFLRLVDDLVGVAELLPIASGAVLVPLAAAVILAPEPLPRVLLLAMVAYIGGLLIYGSLVLLRESRHVSGVARRRTQAAALGSVLLGLTAVLMGGRSTIPVAEGVTRLLTLAAALSYAAAFIPPGFLRSAWREPVLRRFVTRAGAVPAGSRIEDVRAELELAAAEVVGATVVELAVRDRDGAVRLRTGEVVAADSLLGRAIAERHGVLSTDLGRDDPAVAKRHPAARPRTAIVAPLTDRGEPIGALAAYFRRIPLFPEEDLSVTEILAAQSGTVIGHTHAYARLAETNERLESATRAKTMFLANMSHELRTPLNATLGFSDLLLEQLEPTLTTAQRRYFANIRDAGRHLLDLINEVLDLSKVEAGRLELRLETIRLHDLVEAAVSSAATAAGAREVDLRVELLRGLDVRVDPGRIRQVLHNLLSNAVKFTDRGGQVVLRASADGPDLLLQVADTGIGIPKDAHDRVFATFERLHEHRPNTTGTGLGLALTKRLVEAHGGTISFESEPGKGTTFRVRLPNSVVEPMTGERLLIVEDDVRDAELVAALATSVGLRSEVARSAAEARAAVERSAPTAVVLDLRLPDERGETFLEEIKARPETSRIPVIVVTVEDDEGSSRPLGAEDHLTKPIDAERLSSWLRRTVARNGARLGGGAAAPE